MLYSFYLFSGFIDVILLCSNFTETPMALSSVPVIVNKSTKEKILTYVYSYSYTVNSSIAIGSE